MFTCVLLNDLIKPESTVGLNIISLHSIRKYQKREWWFIPAVNLLSLWVECTGKDLRSMEIRRVWFNCFIISWFLFISFFYNYNHSIYSFWLSIKYWWISLHMSFILSVLQRFLHAKILWKGNIMVFTSYIFPSVSAQPVICTDSYMKQF